MRDVTGWKALPSLAVSISLAMPAVVATAATTGAAPPWLKNFVRVANGKQFCAPPSATLDDFATVIDRYQQTHPELDGVIGGQDVIAAFSAAYPCPAQATEDTPEASPPTDPLPQEEAPASPSSTAASADTPPIDTARAMAIARQLTDTTGNENDALVSTIERHPGDYPPPVLFALTNLLYLQGKTDDAIFWLSAARLRANFDALRCTDQTASLGVGEMMKLIPLALRRAQFADLPKLRLIVSRAVKWDEETPYRYDHRWINAYGVRTSAAGPATDQPDLSVPREQWPALASKTRADYVASLDGAIRQIEARK